MKIVDLDENLYQTIAESFDKRLHWEPSFNSKYTREYYTDADGKELKINYFSPDAFENEVAISFSVNDRQDITGAGNANAIFGAVINHINDFVKSNNIQKIKFTAHKPEGSFGVRDTARSDLYRKMVKKLSNSLGFEYSVEDSGNNDIFTLVRKSQLTNESTSQEIIDNVEGWGAVPLNQEVNYFGLRVMMKPSVFLSLAAPLDREPSEKIVQHLQDNGKIASPFMNIAIPPEWEDAEFGKEAKVVGHEGRNRMKAILKLFGDIPIETHLFFRSGMRRRHLTDDMIKNLVNSLQAERSDQIVSGPLFVLNENINEDGRIVKGVNTTVDVGVDEIKRQAAKFGNTVDKDGRPPTLSKKTRGSKTNVLYNLGLTENASLLNELIMDTSGISAGSDWKNEYWGKNIKELPGLPQPVSEYKDYTIYFAGSMDKPKVYVVDSKNKVVGRLELMKISTKAPIYRVNIAVLSKPLRSRNLMQGIYVHLIQEHEMILAADIIQSAGAMRSWAKLNTNPAITVYSAIKNKNGDWKYSRLEGDEYLSGADQIYRKEYQDQISELENEKSSTEKILTQLRKDLRRGVKGARKEDVGFLEQKIKDLETEISKTREEQRQREQAGIDSVYLLASASRKRLPAPKKESILKMKTRDIFPDLEDELLEGPMDTLKKFGRGAALATSIGTAGTMGALGYDGVGKASTDTTQSGYSQLAPTTSKTPKPRPQQAEPEKKPSGSELAPEKSPRPVPRSSSLTITDNPEEKQLLDYAKKNNITGSELAALMSQAAVETQGFSRMVEQGPRSYFNRYEPEHAPERASILGNKYSGDGYKYRGRGYVQLTGRYNYYRAGKALGLDLINEPDLAANPENALKIALWYWNWRVSPSTDNFDNVKKVTYLINGGYHGLDKRELYFNKYTRRMQLASEKTESKKYTPLEMAIMEGGHTLESNIVDFEGKKQDKILKKFYSDFMSQVKAGMQEMAAARRTATEMGVFDDFLVGTRLKFPTGVHRVEAHIMLPTKTNELSPNEREFAKKFGFGIPLFLPGKEGKYYRPAIRTTQITGEMSGSEGDHYIDRLINFDTGEKRYEKFTGPTSVKESQKTSRLYNALMEGIKIQLERDDDMYILHIRDSNQKHRVEVRGKSGYERGGYDKKDSLHTLIDNLGKAANISDLMNGEPVYINPDHPDGPRAIKYLKKAMNENKADSNIKIHDVSVRDHYRGESFGEKVLSVNGEPKAVITLSILGDEVYIQNIQTAKSSQRQGYAKAVVDDLFREFPNKTITVSMMTDDGSKFFRKQYDVDEETGEIKKR